MSAYALKKGRTGGRRTRPSVHFLVDAPGYLWGTHPSCPWRTRPHGRRPPLTGAATMQTVAVTALDGGCVRLGRGLSLLGTRGGASAATDG